MSRLTCQFYKRIAFRHDEVKGWSMFRLRCKSWQCEVCQKENQRQWRRHLRKRLPAISENWWFGTITAPSWNRTPGNTLHILRTNFDRFMKRLRRVWKKGVDYVWIFERHKTGAFHLHIIISGLTARVKRVLYRGGKIGFVPVTGTAAKAGTWSVLTWWKKTLSKCGCGYMADVKVIPHNQAIMYVTNYMTKSAQSYWIKNMRRISTSRAIGSPQPARLMHWQIADVIWASAVNFEKIHDLDLRVTVPVTFWLDSYVYPRGSDTD